MKAIEDADVREKELRRKEEEAAELVRRVLNASTDKEGSENTHCSVLGIDPIATKTGIKKV